MNINIQYLWHDVDEEIFTKFKSRNTPENHLLYVEEKIAEIIKRKVGDMNNSHDFIFNDMQVSVQI
jgi:hypothetical protein